MAKPEWLLGFGLYLILKDTGTLPFTSLCAQHLVQLSSRGQGLGSLVDDESCFPRAHFLRPYWQRTQELSR